VNRHDRVLPIVLAAEHLLDFARFDLSGKLVEGAAEVVHDRLPRFGPFDQHGEIVDATAEGATELRVLLEATAALQQLLGGCLVLPEVWGGDSFFYLREFVRGAGSVKDGSADRGLAASDPRTCGADHLVEWASTLQLSAISLQLFLLSRVS
jgi:hypothetical protein